MALAALFVAGTIAGAGGVALASSASGSRPSLVTAPLLNSDYERSAEGVVTLAVDVFNSGEQDVPDVVRSFAGWPVSGSETETEVLSAGAWTQLEIIAAPDCDAVLTEVMAVDAGSYSLDVPPGRDIPRISRRTEVDSATADDHGLRIDLRLLGHGRRALGDLQLIDARPPARQHFSRDERADDAGRLRLYRARCILDCRRLHRGSAIYRPSGSHLHHPAGRCRGGSAR